MGLFDKLFGDKNQREVEKHSVMCVPKTVYSPLKGRMIPLDQVDDPAFAQGIIGPGVGIEPEEGMLYAPVDGVIVALFPTGHAVGIQTEDGMELLIHIGIDTVDMNGDGFKPLVKQGDQVKAGTPLVEFNCDKIMEAGHKATTMILVSNVNAIADMKFAEFGNKNVLDILYSVK